MKIYKSLFHLAALFWLVLLTAGPVSGKVASGVFDLSGNSCQQKHDAKTLICQANHEINSKLASGSLDAPNKGVPCVGGQCGSALDGIYSKIKPLNDEFPELVGVNPHLVKNAEAGVNTNCVSCVNAAVDRLTGRNPKAVADSSKGYGQPNDLLPSSPFGFVDEANPVNPGAVTKNLINNGDGSIAVVRIQQAGDVEHVIIGVNKAGEIHYIDPQLGSIVQLKPDLPVIAGYR